MMKMSKLCCTFRYDINQLPAYFFHLHWNLLLDVCLSKQFHEHFYTNSTGKKMTMLTGEVEYAEWEKDGWKYTGMRDKKTGKAQGIVRVEDKKTNSFIEEATYDQDKL